MSRFLEPFGLVPQPLALLKPQTKPEQYNIIEIDQTDAINSLIQIQRAHYLPLN